MRAITLSSVAVALAVGCGNADSGATSSNSSNTSGNVDAYGAGAGRDAGTVTSKRDTGASSYEKDAGRGAVDDTCERATVHTALATPEMLIVLDRSGSMSPALNDTGTDRWSGSVQAVNEVTASFDQQIDFGLMTFPAFNGTQGNADDLLGSLIGPDACAAGKLDVPIASNNADAISQTLGAMSPGGFTPTAATLTEALNVLNEPVVADQGTISPKYVLLVTDGDPNCSDGGSGLSALGGIDHAARQQTLDAIKALADAGVQTFVVGYQTAGTQFAGQLDQMAAAGGTGETQHHSVSSGADLMSTFESIVQRVLSCSYQLEKAVSDASYVQVTVGGQPRDFQKPSDGWTLGPDDKTVVLTGKACDDLQGGATFTVEVLCEVVRGI
ncbi:MAG TPA: vWA domain-containing protein [Polyangiaceae bacterium]|nr:vWA domain-containing protein [Polyangiaceae bacterium]